MRMLTYLFPCFKNRDRNLTSSMTSINTNCSCYSNYSMISTSATIGYMTDCEGNYDYWNRYLSKSYVMNKVNNHIILKDNCHFVYGGDVCDRGTGDIRLLLDLISLKRRYPQRVHFIMGNRDCNKLRLKFELHESTALKCYPKVYWIKDDPLSNKEAGRVDRNINNRSNRLKWILSNTMGAPVAYESRKIELNLIKSTFDPSIYPSNYIYSNTISDDEITQSFEDLIDTKLDSKEFSKADGQIDSKINGKIDKKTDDKLDSKIDSKISITVDTQLEDYPEADSAINDSIGFNGLLLEYLYHAKICLILADVLFIHGAIHPYNMGWVPPSKNSLSIELTDESRYVEDVFEWADRLNEFAHSEILDYINNSDNYLIELEIEYIAKQQSHYLSSGELIDLLEPTHWAAVGGYDHKQPGSRLLQYGMGYMPDKSINPSVIYANYLSHGQPVPPNVAVIKAMKSRGINKIVVGHQPHGDAPVVIDEGGLQLICADTSYSKNALWNDTTIDCSTESTKDSWHTASNICINEYLKLERLEANLNLYDKPACELLHNISRRRSCTTISSSPSISETNINVDSKIDRNLDSKVDIEVDRNPTDNLSTISNDTSTNILNNLTEYQQQIGNTRGISIAEILFNTFSPLTSPLTNESMRLLENKESSRVYIHGVLSNGCKYDFELLEPQNNIYVGKLTKDGFYVKAYGIKKLTNKLNNQKYIIDSPINSNDNNSYKRKGYYFLLCKGEKYNCKNKLIHENDIDKEFH